MNRKKVLVSFVIVAMLLFSSLVFPVRATPSDWSKPRPSGPTLYNEAIGNSETNGVASIGVGVEICDYVPRTDGINYDMLRLRITTSANTRVGIQYTVLPNPYIYDWCEVSEPTNITSDNSGTWLDLEFTFLYYGVDYYRIWVCSNGFLTLNNTCTNADPQSIPSTDDPNPVIAVFWRDLHPEQGGSITYGSDVYFNGEEYFVVSWNNVPDDSGTPQTFQVLIQHRQPCGNDYHNKIFFQYKSITKSYSTTVGTEDQVGNKGTAYDYNNLHNEACLKFDYFIAGYRLERLWIKLTKSDGYARIGVEEDDTGGCNVKLKDYTNPYEDDFKFAIKTTATLLLWKASIAWKGMLIIADLAGVLANDISPVKPEYTKDAWEGDSEAWAYGDCKDENPIYCKPFDSTLATTICWKFIDENDKDHDLTVTADAWYKDMSNEDYTYEIFTSSTLNMHIGKTLSISASSGGNADPDPGTHTYDYGESVLVTASAYSGYTFDGWILDGSIIVDENPINVTMDSDHTLDAYFSVSGGGGSGGGEPCPTLFVWDGNDYVDYGVIDIHDPSGEDMVREVPVQSEDVDISNYKARFRLREGWEGLNFSESVIDQVKLYAVDNDGNRYLCPLISATHSNLGNVLPQLRKSDDVKAQMLLLETIDLTFIMPYQNVQGFTFIIEGCNMIKY
jgi:hypothetical protein